MCDFLAQRNVEFLVREVSKVYPAVPVKVILPKLKGMMVDWYHNCHPYKYGKSTWELNDMFISEIIYTGTMFADANCGSSTAAIDKGCGYQQASEINSCDPNMGCNMVVYYRERPEVINDGFRFKGAPPSDYELYMAKQVASTIPDMDAAIMKSASGPTKYTINQILHKSKFIPKYRNQGDKAVIAGERICGEEISPHYRQLCGRCTNFKQKCTIPFAYYPSTCDNAPSTGVTSYTI